MTRRLSDLRGSTPSKLVPGFIDYARDPFANDAAFMPPRSFSGTVGVYLLLPWFYQNQRKFEAEKREWVDGMPQREFDFLARMDAHDQGMQWRFSNYFPNPYTYIIKFCRHTRRAEIQGVWNARRQGRKERAQ